MSKIKTTTYSITTQILPAATSPQEKTVQYDYTLNLQAIPVNISSLIQQSSIEYLDSVLSRYFDDKIELKTLVNFGEDKQSVVLSKRYGVLDEYGYDTVQVKLLKPLPDEFTENTPVFISREVATSIIDLVNIKFAPDIDDTPYLRPRNTGINISDASGKALRNVTLKLLSLETGSLGTFDNSKNVSFEDQIYRRWYSYDFNSAELNLDFSNYAEFVMYGSAKLRLQSFRQKLQTIEKLTAQSKQFEGSVFTGSLASAGATYILEQSAKFAKEKEDIIRSFDRYEQYLYFTPAGTDSPYSASFDYVEGGIEYNPIGYWPKISGSTLYSVDSEIAKLWFDTQLSIAERYDEYNLNNLVNTIPSHILAQEDSSPYFTFVLMIGHFFDLIKPYIDQFPYIHSRYTNPDEELSKDLVVDIAEAVGFKLPAINDIYDISAAVLGTEEVPPRRDFAAETHKRLLHNLPLFVKSKGTKTALVTALKTIGITPQIMNVVESGTAVTSSIYVFDEFSNGIQFNSGSVPFVKIPMLAMQRTPYPRMLQFSVKIPNRTDSTILSNDESWALNVISHPSNPLLGRFELTSGSNYEPILTSSYYEIFDNELLNVVIRTFDDESRTELMVFQTLDDQIIYSSVHSELTNAQTFVPLWDTTQNIFIGGTTSFSIGRFNGILDEFRLWGINLSNDVIINTAFDPGSEAGDNYKAPTEYLYVQVSLNSIDESILPTQIRNESPYKDKQEFDDSPSIEFLETSDIGLDNIVRYNRSIRQILPQIGSTGYVSSKIRIAPPPVFLPESYSAAGVKQLSRTSSVITSRRRTPIERGRNKVVMTSSPVRIINDTILRAFGSENINGAMGLPEKYKVLEGTLPKLQNYYNQYYYVNVDYNKYIRIMSGIHSVLRQFVEYFIPSKASLLGGIVIEPHYLEQSKISFPKNIRVYGAGTRKTRDAASSLTGSAADYGATFNLNDTIDLRLQEITGSYNTTEGRIVRPLELNESFDTYWIQHEDWQRATLISESNAPPRQVSIDLSGEITKSTYNTIDKQHLDWADAFDLSQSLHTGSHKWHEVPTIQISQAQLPASFQLIDKKHLTWDQFRIISHSRAPGTASIQYRSAPYGSASSDAGINKIHPTTFIDMGTGQLNKIGFYAENNGRPGAEPYNRVYPRKLFDYEINATRDGGVTSLNINGVYDIPPFPDFKELGAYTYFNNLDGIYYFPERILDPKYRNPLNQRWDIDEQTFESATTWSYGTRYNVNDVVYQKITKEDTQLGELTSSAFIGNDYYYVFNTAPLYTSSADGSPGYIDNVPSYIPPSLDGTNWTRLRFRPDIKLIPRRVVFDTFRVTDPSLNNFKTTTISVDKAIDRPDRYIDVARLGNISPNGFIQGEILVQNIAALFAMQVNTENIRVRLYRTKEVQSSDFDRNFQTVPTGSHGVLLDLQIVNRNVIQLTNPIVTLVADSIPPAGKIFYTIENLTTETKVDVNLVGYYFAIEIEKRVPIGYLRKHYRFYRDNSTATKRRNYIGCKNTEGTTIDGLPPVQIFLSEGSEIIVSPTDSGDQIITGGGGTLNTTGNQFGRLRRD